MSGLLESVVRAVKVNLLSPKADAKHYRRAVQDRQFGTRFPSIPVASMERFAELADQASQCVVFGEPGASRWLLDHGKKVVHLDRDHGRAFGVEFRLTPAQAENLTLRVVEHGDQSGRARYRALGVEAMDDNTMVVIAGTSRRKVLAQVMTHSPKPRSVVVVDGGSRQLREACREYVEQGWRADVVWGLSASASSVDASVTFITA